MFIRRRLPIALTAAATLAVAAPAFADNFSFPTTLSGYNETPSTLNSPAAGQFLAKVSKDESSISYTLTYSGFANTTVTQAHIHFGRPALQGGIVLFLCTNLTPPAGVPVPPPCPLTGGTVTGTLTAANLIAVSAQGIDSDGAGFAEVIKALRNGAAYANVHTTVHPGGEIRGPLGKFGGDDEDENEND